MKHLHRVVLFFRDSDEFDLELDLDLEEDLEDEE